MAKTEKPKTPASTEYVVLERVELPTAEAWVPVTELDPDTPKVFRASGKQAAIRQHTGDGADVLEGTWRAVPVSSWRGGVVTRRVTSAERVTLDA